MNLKTPFLTLLFLFSFSIAFSQALNQPDDSCHMVPKYIPFKVNDKYGYCDKNKNILIKPIFDQAEPFMELRYSDKIKSASDQYATVKIGKDFFRINTSGKIMDKILPEKILSESMDFDPSGMEPSFRIVKRDSIYWLGTYKGTMVLREAYQLIYPYDQSLYFSFPFIVKKNNKFGVVLADGRIVVPLIYDEIYTYSIDYYLDKIRLVKVERNKEIFLVDFCGNEYR